MVKIIWIVALILQGNLFAISQDAVTTLQEVLDIRTSLRKEEINMMTGHDIELSDTELEANRIIMDLKEQILEDGHLHPERPIFSKGFFECKEDIDNSELFKIIEQMPKGGVLHAHDTGLLSPDYVLNMTYWDNLYVCWNYGCDLQFRFSDKKPNIHCNSNWKLVKDLRETSKNVEQFDDELRTCFTLKVPNSRETYPHINAAWNKFQTYFDCTAGLFGFIDAWKQYFYDTLVAFRNDKVMYLEIRSVLPDLYDLDGNVFDAVETARTYKMVAEQFIADYPDFFGVKLIYAPPRFANNEDLEEYLLIAKKIKEEMPDFFAGFDLVGQEDVGNRTKDFLSQLVTVANDIDFFFHSGETNWYGMTDDNLYDAIALNVKRIGHGYALLKHPILVDIVKKNNIALEVNVISNQVLKLVEDLRNHPIATFLALDLPVVISSDDPGLWEATPMTHDFYVTFVVCAHKKADLRLLKKLALNSLYYSSITDKHKAVHQFEIQWTKFISNLVNNKI